MSVQVKEERHDEAEIMELANKMKEQHKTAAAKAVMAQQQQAQNQTRIGQTTAPNMGSQSNILNFLQRQPTNPAQTNLQQTQQQQQQQQQQKTSSVLQNGNQNKAETINSDNNVDDKLPCDEESAKGHFGWETILSGKLHIPYILRQQEKYCAVRIIEQKLLSKYLNYLHADLFNCTCVRSYYITETESRLLNEINIKHCDSAFGKDPFTTKDLVVRVSEALKFFTFLEVCYKKLLMNCSTPNDKCGFIRINKESVVPYTIRDGQKMVPLFYFEGETDNLKLKADSLSGWDLSYLKFCCKVQGIRNELFASDTVAVISLDDIKSYFPQGTIFEDYWPNKVVDSQLLVGSKSTNSVVHWTRQPSHPPPKQMMPQLPKAQQQVVQQNKQVQQRNMAAAAAAALQNPALYSAELQAQYLRMQQSIGSSTQAGLTSALQAIANGWSNQFSAGQIEQMLRMQNKANHNAMRQYNQQSNSRQQQQQQQQQQQNIQNMLQSQLYNYGNITMGSNVSSSNSRNSSQQAPPPLVRSNQSSQNHLSNCVSGSSILRSNATTNNPDSYSSQSNQTANNNSQNIVTITRCPPQNNSNAMNSFLNKIPQSTTITPSSNSNQFYKDLSLPSSLSIYPKNSGPSRNTIQSSSVSPAIASPTRASPQGLHAKQPSQSPASPMQNLLPAVIQQQFDELFNSQNFSLNGVSEILKETLMSLSQCNGQQYPGRNIIANSMTSPNSQQQNARNKSVITSRASMDVIDLSPSSTPSRSSIQSTVAAAAVAAQQQAVKRNVNGQYINGQSNRSMQQSSSSSSANTRAMQQQQQSQYDLNNLNNLQYAPYKVQRMQIENAMVPCVNMVSYVHNVHHDLLMPISELKESFYPSLNLDVCRRVMMALDITLYKGNKGQYQAYLAIGKSIPENVPLVKVTDIMQYMPQISYMMRASNSQDTTTGLPSSKRVCMS